MTLQAYNEQNPGNLIDQKSGFFPNKLQGRRALESKRNVEEYQPILF